MTTVEPIRKIEDIRKVEKILEKQSKRNLLFFTIGTNCGLRISDILRLNVGDVRGKTHIQIIEKNLIYNIICSKSVDNSPQKVYNKRVYKIFQIMKGYIKWQKDAHTTVRPARAVAIKRKKTACLQLLTR